MADNWSKLSQLKHQTEKLIGASCGKFTLKILHHLAYLCSTPSKQESLLTALHHKSVDTLVQRMH